MKTNPPDKYPFMCSWVLGMQVRYYGQFTGVLRGLLSVANGAL
jgi:hypothetical protein